MHYFTKPLIHNFISAATCEGSLHYSALYSSGDQEVDCKSVEVASLDQRAHRITFIAYRIYSIYDFTINHFLQKNIQKAASDFTTRSYIPGS